MIRKILLTLALLASPLMAWAVAAPTGLAGGTWVNSTLPLSWTEDATVSQWYIYVNGNLFASPIRTQASLSGTTRTYVLSPLAASTSPWVIYMRALATGAPLSVASASITVTSAGVPFTYVMTPPGTFLSVSLSTGSGGSASAVTVISSVLPTGASTSALQTSGNSTLTTINTNFNNVTVNTHAVTQGGPWTVSGSVSTSPSGAYQGVSVFAGVAGLTVTASQGSPWTVSGSVGVTSGVAGISVTASQGSPWTVSGSVGVSSAVPLTVNTHAVTQGGPWTVSGSVSTVPSGAYQGVSVFAGVAGLTVTASQGSPWTVSGSVGVTSGVAGISVTASQGGGFWGVSVTSMPAGVTVNTHAVTQGGPWTVSGSVGVTSGVAGLTVTASQGSPWTVSGSVGVTSGVAGLTVTASQGSPWTVSGSVGVSSFPAAFLGVSVVSQVDASTFKGVSVVTSVLPTGAATSALQTSGNSSLTSINNKIPLATNTVRQRTVITAATTETTILTSGGVGVFHDIDLIFVSNPDSNTDCTVSFRDATTGSIIFEGHAARAGGGFVLPFPVALPQAASNNNWTAEIDLAASPGIIINVVGHVRQ